MKVEKERSSLARNLFSTILKLGSTANPKLARQRRAQTVGFAAASASLRIVSEKILIRAQSFLSPFLVKYSGNDFDTSGLKEFGQQPVPTCSATGGNRVNARRRERTDMSVSFKNPKLF